MAVPPRKIFISYRRDDHPDFVARICDYVRTRYGYENVFLDADTIPPLAKFEKFIRYEVEKCSVMLVIIGPRWLELMQEKAANFKKDYVQMEVSLAIRLGKLAAPICILGAQIPDVDKLPKNLRPLFKSQAAFLTRDSFIVGIESILSAIERELVSLDDVIDTTPPKELTEEGQKIAEALEQFLPSDAVGYYERGYLRGSIGDHKGAIIDLTEAIRLGLDENTVGMCYIWRAYARRQVGDLDGAITDFSEVIQIFDNVENSGDFYMQRGKTYYKKGSMEEAITDYTEAISIWSENDKAFEGRGKAHFVLKQYDQALSDFERADEISSTSETITGLAIAYYSLGKHDEAVQLWFPLIDEDERYIDADWVGKQFDWTSRMIETADRLIEVGNHYY